MIPILVAHGTRKTHGVELIGQLAERVSAELGRRVRTAFVDVLGPTPFDVLTSLPDDARAVLVPALLSSGYHVRRDLPAHVAASGRRNAVVTPAMGPSPELIHVVAERLVDAGWRRSDSVVLAAAGTSDACGQQDLRITAAMLSAALGRPVELAFAATGELKVDAAVARLRAHGARRVAVASYLLSDGLFQDRLQSSGADVVAAPLGTHPGIVELLAARFRSGVGELRREGIPRLPTLARS